MSTTVTLSMRQKLALALGSACTMVPAMIVTGFMPEWDVLPLTGWLTIATLGSGLAGAIGAARSARGAIAGGLTGGGAMLGIMAYMAIRSAILPIDTYLRLEFAIGAVFGAIPGMLLFRFWVRR